MRIVLVCALAFVSAVPALAAASRPAVRIVDLRPVALRGSGFEPYERVRLAVRVGERTSVAKRLRAGARGRFAVTFPEHSLGRCGNELAVSAAGARGSRVSWVLTQPDCFDD
jgi:hypothetical protein